MQELARINPITIDRQKGTVHPRWADLIDPLDYGYLENTFAGDGNGIDLCSGFTSDKILTGILCTFDRLTQCRQII